MPETILKKSAIKQKLRANKIKRIKAATKARKEKRRVIFQRAEKYVREYRSKERELIRFRRTAKNAGNFFVEPEAKLAFVIRIRGYVLLPIIHEIFPS